MKAPKLKTANQGLSSVQFKAFEKFRRKLKGKVPDYRLTWVHPYNETIIEAGVEFPQKTSYRKGLRVAKLAIEVHDETGVLIILR
jgi:hypothetical protein